MQYTSQAVQAPLELHKKCRNIHGLETSQQFFRFRLAQGKEQHCGRCAESKAHHAWAVPSHPASINAWRCCK